MKIHVAPWSSLVTFCLRPSLVGHFGPPKANIVLIRNTREGYRVAGQVLEALEDQACSQCRKVSQRRWG